MNARRSSWGPISATAIIIAVVVVFGELHAVTATQTAPNTVISNTSSASYTDAASNNYTANSNTVTVTVQNAPSITLSASSAKTIAPGQTISDAFTITNTGNAAGDVQITAGGVTGGSDSSYATGATWSYTYGGTTTTAPDEATLNTDLAAIQVPTGSTIVVSVVYPLQSTATSGNTVITGVTGTITYVANGAAAAQTSTALASPTETDTVQADVRVDVGLTSSQNGTTGVVSYTLNAADGTGTWGAKDSAAVKLLLGTASQGVFISAKIPQFGGVPLAVSGNASVTNGTTANGYPISGATSTIYYTTNATGAGGAWTSTTGAIGAGATYIGVFITGGTCTINGASMSGVEICPATTPTSTPGTVNNPAITLTFAVVAPTGTGSANTGSMTTIGNSIIGDNATTEHVIAPGITANSQADSTATINNLTAGNYGIDNTTALAAPSGASGIASNQALPSYYVLNGPYNSPAATGQYDGIGSNDNNHDFTAVSFVATGDAYKTTNTVAGYSATTASVTSAAVASIPVESTVQNNGNLTDTINVVAQAPTGWKVTLETDPNPGTGLCVGSVAWSGAAQSAAGGTSTAANVSVPSGGSVNYCAIYSAPAGVTYLSHVVGIVTATSTNLSTGLGVNVTNHLLYAGFVAITTTQTVTSTGCNAGVVVPASGICPSGVITYVIDYHNVVNNVDTSSVPAQSFQGVITKAGTLVITADGSTGQSLGNNWGATTGGASSPTDTTGGTVFTCYTGANGGTSGTCGQAGVTKFTAKVGGAAFQLVPALYGSGTSLGQITFTVTVN